MTTYRHCYFIISFGNSDGKKHWLFLFLGYSDSIPVVTKASIFIIIRLWFSHIKVKVANLSMYNGQKMSYRQ